jgi:hypothetical protein
VHRRARLIEISPTYVDTIVRRWERFTGEQAVLLATNQTFAEVQYDRAPLEANNENGVGSQHLHKESAEDSEARETSDD